VKINVGMLTAQLASYEPELDILEGYTPDPWDASSCQVLSSRSSEFSAGSAGCDPCSAHING